MSNAASRGKLDGIVAWSIDRLGRSLANVGSFLAEMQQQVAFLSASAECRGTTAAGKAMLGMATVFAEFERAVAIERINAGLARARKQGRRLRPSASL
jgi:DNA invertase Pin-like site-specific DNA recombinase